MDLNEQGRIGRQIAALRRERGLTQEELAEALQVSPQAVSKWENNRSLPETALLSRLARVLDCGIDDLFGEGRLLILDAWYGDGLEKINVTRRLNRLIENDSLTLEAAGAASPALSDRERISYLTLKIQNEAGVSFHCFRQNEPLALDAHTTGLEPQDQGLRIVAGSYGSAKYHYDVMQKIAHYDVFRWNAYRANHELFPSDPASDDPEFLTLVYLNAAGIHLVTCEEGESIAYLPDRTGLVRQAGRENDVHFIPDIEHLPPFGGGMECSWGAALTAALRGMGVRTTYEEVMGVSGACWRLAFCSPMWDYSSVDGLVAYDYAQPGYRAYGYTLRCVGRVEKEERAAERQKILRELRSNMPVLAINLRVAAEWGVICGYREGGTELYCRTKYDAEILNRPDFVSGHKNPYDYLLVDNWPFIILYFNGQTAVPSPAENLMASLRVFVDCAAQEKQRGYAMGFQAWETWIRDLLDEDWYKNAEDQQIERRLSVNQFCTLSLHDARRAAHQYLSGSAGLFSGAAGERLAKLAGLFGEITTLVERVHAMLDTGEYLRGAAARRFWTPEKRREQAALFGQAMALEQKAYEIAGEIIKT